MVDSCTRSAMPIASGTTLGVYEIATALGAGGMGEVYRARDTKLGSGVAVKILPDAFSFYSGCGPFQREAKVVARSIIRTSRASGLERPTGAISSSWSSWRARRSPKVSAGPAARRGGATWRADRRSARSGARTRRHPPRPEAGQRQGHAERQGQGARLRAGQGDGRTPARRTRQSPT